MVIDPNNIGSVSGSSAKGKLAGGERVSEQKPRGTAADKKDPAPPAGDSVSLSAEAQSIGKLEAAISATPDVDSARVESVRHSLQSGQYRIDADAIAEKILNQR